jgi:hypothetical protein
MTLISVTALTRQRKKNAGPRPGVLIVFQQALKNLELLLNLTVEETLDGVRSQSVITLVAAVTVEG